MFVSVLLVLACGQSTPDPEAPAEAERPKVVMKKLDGPPPGHVSPSAGSAPTADDGGQSYEAGVQALCDAWKTCPNCRDADAATAAFNLNRNVEKVVTNREVINMFWQWSEQSRADRAKALQAATERAGLESCDIGRMFKDVAGQ
ncbi:MAG: hypothetical protein KTR31_11680 [Myxococcales bacterium]|nr:hypothetical protein [Myxococcales bacterium]